MLNKNIVLIGFSGCGKTTIGRRLARIRGMEFADTDVILEAEAGMPITKIFENFGEDYFRGLETETIKKTASAGGRVIATGGGCVKNEKNMRLLADNGVIVYLKCSASKIFENVKHDTTRPLLNTDDKLKRIEEMLEQRRELYEKYAQLTVDISDDGLWDAVKKADAAVALHFHE
ncbi:MAG: shikimate kinase [Clostridiales bacterium]|jgi:shikimate kinase|nr:shikimate kinase [Clostridiales bacterium]